MIREQEIYLPTLSVSYGASGAYCGVRQSQLVVVVDVIDMSTTLETALENGAIAVFGASPTGRRVPFPVNPRGIGQVAGRLARDRQTGVVLIGEPRTGPLCTQRVRCQEVLEGLAEAGIWDPPIFPNMGKDTAHMVDFRDRVVIAVTDAGGTVFDVAYTAGGHVLTGTVARTGAGRSIEPAGRAVARAVNLAKQLKLGICVVAASPHALEDVIAAHHLAELIISTGFLNH